MEDFIVATTDEEFKKLVRELNPDISQEKLDNALNEGEYEYNGCMVSFD